MIEIALVPAAAPQLPLHFPPCNFCGAPMDNAVRCTAPACRTSYPPAGMVKRSHETTGIARHKYRKPL